MRDFFSLDGPFYKWGSVVADIMILSVMWILFSLPVITVGASTSALFYVTTRRISEREGYVTRDFWTAFKQNFKTATVVWLIQLAVSFVLYLNIINISATGSLQNILLPFQIVFILEVFFISIYLYPLIARFEMNWKQAIKNAFFMANRHFFTSITCAALAVAIVFGTLMYMLLALVAMGIYAWLSSYLIMRIFKKYRPEMDKNPLLELQELELEREAKKKEEREV